MRTIAAGLSLVSGLVLRACGEQAATKPGPALDDPLAVGRPLEPETVRPWLTPVVRAHLAVGDLEGPVDGWFRTPTG